MFEIFRRLLLMVAHVDNSGYLCVLAEDIVVLAMSNWSS